MKTIPLTALSLLLAMPPSQAQTVPSVASPAAEAYAEGQKHLASRTTAELRAARESFERAIAADANFAPVEAALKLDPTLATAYYFIGRARVEQHRFPDARKAFARAREISPDANLLSAEGYLDARAGQRDAARRAIARTELLAVRDLPFASQIAGIHAALGEKDDALEWLRRARLAHEGALVWLKIDPRFDSLRREPGFQEILRRMGL